MQSWALAAADALDCAMPGAITGHCIGLLCACVDSGGPVIDMGDFLPADFKEDEEAGFMGLPFIQPEGDDEWMDNVPWEEVPEEAAL